MKIQRLYYREYIKKGITPYASPNLFEPFKLATDELKLLLKPEYSIIKIKAEDIITLDGTSCLVLRDNLGGVMLWEVEDITYHDNGTVDLFSEYICVDKYANPVEILHGGITGIPEELIITAIKEAGNIQNYENNLKKIIAEKDHIVNTLIQQRRRLEEDIKVMRRKLALFEIGNEAQAQNPQTESLLDKFTKGDANYLTEEEREFLGI